MLRDDDQTEDEQPDGYLAETKSFVALYELMDVPIAQVDRYSQDDS